MMNNARLTLKQTCWKQYNFLLEAWLPSFTLSICFHPKDTGGKHKRMTRHWLRASVSPPTTARDGPFSQVCEHKGSVSQDAGGLALLGSDGRNSYSLQGSGAWWGGCMKWSCGRLLCWLRFCSLWLFAWQEVKEGFVLTDSLGIQSMGMEENKAGDALVFQHIWDHKAAG